jgi:hypothetical protein
MRVSFLNTLVLINKPIIETERKREYFRTMSLLEMGLFRQLFITRK